MMSSKEPLFRTGKIFLVLGFLVLASTSSVVAASKDPEPKDIPAMTGVVRSGAKIYYIGNRNGLDGWFIYKDGRVEIAYTTPDKRELLIGIMFGENGENISSAQIKTTMDTNKELSNLMIGMQDQSAQLQQMQPVIGGSSTPQTFLPSTAMAPSALATPALSPQAAPAQIAPEPVVPTLSPGERLYQELSIAPGVVIGSATPRLLMVMDPDCPHCQATWRTLRDSVFKNIIQIRMIPIAPPGSDNEREAAQLLRVPDPLNVWDKYVGLSKGQGDKSQLAGTSDPTLIEAVRANHVIIDAWHIHETPYILYRDKTGKIKVIIGEPQNIPALFADLVP